MSHRERKFAALMSRPLIRESGGIPFDGAEMLLVHDDLLLLCDGATACECAGVSVEQIIAVGTTDVADRIGRMLWDIRTGYGPGWLPSVEKLCGSLDEWKPKLATALDARSKVAVRMAGKGHLPVALCLFQPAWRPQAMECDREDRNGRGDPLRENVPLLDRIRGPSPQSSCRTHNPDRDQVCRRVVLTTAWETRSPVFETTIDILEWRNRLEATCPRPALRLRGRQKLDRRKARRDEPALLLRFLDPFSGAGSSVET